MEDRLKTLLYNAICYMLEDMCDQDDWSMDEILDEISDYLGSSVKELVELDVLDYDELIELYGEQIVEL